MTNNTWYYDIDGLGRVPRVTAILGIINKPALMLWQARQGSLKARNIMANLMEKSPYIYKSIMDEFGPDFFRDGNSLANEAADYGKQAHAIIERILKGEAVPMADEPDPVVKAVQSFNDWYERVHFAPIKTESLLYSRKHMYAGTCDAIGETIAGTTLLDWKTSKGIYPEYKLQAVAYKYAAEEMSGVEIPNIMICRFGKDGSFEDYIVPKEKHEDYFQRFLDAKRLWHWQKEENVSFAA